MNVCNNNGDLAGGGADRGDAFQAGSATRHFDRSATAWLVGQALAQLNRGDDAGSFAYRRVTELLAAREDAVAALVELQHRVPDSDVGLRWNLLHLLGVVGDAAAAGFLVEEAMQPLPEHRRKGGCEGPRDGELLLRTMAIEALLNIARRDSHAAARVLDIVAAKPEQPVLIEAVKAAVALGFGDKLREMLGEQDAWMLGIKTVRHTDLTADTGRPGGGEIGNRVPRLRSDRSAPTGGCGCHGA